MIEPADIMSCINKKILDAFDPVIPINENDIEEGFKRPSFFVQFEDVGRSEESSCFRRYLTVRIYFFPTDRYKYQLEVMKKQSKLEELFASGLWVKTRHIKPVDGIEGDIIDGVLQVKFDISFYDVDESDETGDSSGELMGELYVGD